MTKFMLVFLVMALIAFSSRVSKVITRTQGLGSLVLVFGRVLEK